MNMDELMDEESKPFWLALSHGRLSLPVCGVCGEQFFPPMPSCPTCGAANPSLREVPGIGVVYSWVVVHRTFDPDFAHEVPYTIVAVDMDGGGRVIGRLVGDASATPTAGCKVHFSPFIHNGREFPGFVLSDSPGA